MRFDIPKSYNFHKSKSKDVEVDLIRIFVGGENLHVDNVSIHETDNETKEAEAIGEN